METWKCRSVRLLLSIFFNKFIWSLYLCLSESVIFSNCYFSLKKIASFLGYPSIKKKLYYWTHSNRRKIVLWWPRGFAFLWMRMVSSHILEWSVSCPDCGQLKLDDDVSINLHNQRFFRKNDWSLHEPDICHLSIKLIFNLLQGY